MLACALPPPTRRDPQVIRSENNLEKCRKLWETFSPGKDVWDDWNLMFAFHDQDNHQLNFLVHEASDRTPDGLVPLVHDTKRQRFTLMGGSYPDGRILWIRNEDFPEFFESFPAQTVFFDLGQSWVSDLLQLQPQLEANFAEQDLRYYLLPSEFDYDFHNHIQAFASDKRQKFLYDLRHIRKREPVLHWGQQNEAELFIELVNRNFGADSDYADADNANELRRVIDELEKSGRLKTLTIEVDGEKQACSLSLLHGKKMIALYAASNNDINNLGKLLNFEAIQEGCRLQVEEISFMTGMQWKANWKMHSEACCTMRKPQGPWPAAPSAYLLRPL